MIWDWDTLKDFLAVARTGSLSGAARELRSTQPTVGRRIEAMEDRLGTSLFIRTSRGLQLTETGEAILDHARHLEDEIHAIERITTGEETGLRGTVTIAATEALGASWLTQALLPFYRENPGVHIELNLGYSAVDLLRGEADIAIRMYRPEQKDLIIRKAGSVSFALYAAQSYLNQHGAPRTLAELRQHTFVAPNREVWRFLQPALVSSDMQLGEIVFRANSIMALLNAVRAGYGIGFFTMPFAAQFDDLVPVPLANAAPVTAPMWLVVHRDLRRSARIRAVYDFLGQALTAAQKDWTKGPV